MPGSGREADWRLHQHVTNLSGCPGTRYHNSGRRGARITGSEPARGGSRRRVEVDFPLTRSAWGRIPRKAARRVVISGGSVFIYLIHTETARCYSIFLVSFFGDECRASTD